MPQAPIGAFLWRIQPAIHDRARFFDALALVRREQLRGHRSISPRRHCFLKNTL
jgi:hypothetical protein